MREQMVKSFFAAEPGINHNSLVFVGRRVAEGLDLGEYRYIRGNRLRVAKRIARTLIFNSALLGIHIPPLGHDSGHQINAAGEREDHLAHIGFIDNKVGIVFSDQYLKALINPDPYGLDMDLRYIDVESVTAHECFHVQQIMKYPWKMLQEATRSNSDAASWDNARSEAAAQRYALVYEAERTRLQRARNTAVFLADMGIDPTGILDTPDDIVS